VAEEWVSTQFLLNHGYQPAIIQRFKNLMTSPFLVLRLYDPRLTPFFLCLRWPSWQDSLIPYLWQRAQGRSSSHRLHAAAQLVHAILTCFRLGLVKAGGTEDGAPGETVEDMSNKLISRG
jgi:hypothetical protein